MPGLGFSVAFNLKCVGPCPCKGALPESLTLLDQTQGSASRAAAACPPGAFAGVSGGSVQCFSRPRRAPGAPKLTALRHAADMDRQWEAEVGVADVLACPPAYTCCLMWDHHVFLGTLI